MIEQQQAMERPSVEKQDQSCPAQEAMQESKTKLRKYIQNEPAKSIMIGLGVGIGAGLLFGTAFRSSRRYFSHEEALTEKIGNQVKSSLREIVPASLMKHFRS